MKIHFYPLLFIFGLIAIYWPDAVLAQASYEGQVFDQTTEAAIPFVTVTLAKARTATLTNEQGYFSLYSTSTTEKDSLIFTCVGYKTYRLPVSAYKRGMFVSMQPNSTKLKEIVIGVRKNTKTLEAFSQEQLDPKSWSIESSYPTPLYSAQMYAKLFEAPKPDAVVISIDLGRWQPDPDTWEMQPGKTSRFRIHVMTVNPTNGAPDSILVTREISLQDRSRRISIRLDSNNVVLASTRFFVAVEWLRLPYNEYIGRYQYIYIDNTGLDKIRENRWFDRVIYQPLLAQYRGTSKAPSWLMINGAWQLFERLIQYEIALSATINY